jgi:hypothetical protein
MPLPSPESHPNSISSNKVKSHSESQFTDIRTESYPIKYRTSPLPSLIRETLLFDSIEIPALIESGASMSIISPATLKKIPKSHIHKISNCPPIKVSLAAQGPSPIEIRDQVELCFELKSTNSYYLWRFLVLPNSTNPIILGLDWLETTDFVIDLKLKALKLNPNPEVPDNLEEPSPLTYYTMVLFSLTQ